MKREVLSLGVHDSEPHLLPCNCHHSFCNLQAPMSEMDPGTSEAGS